MIKRISDNIATVLAFLTIVGLVFGGITYFAPMSRLQAMEQQYAYDKMATRMEKVQERIWSLEDRYQLGTDKSRALPVSVKEELRELKKELELLKAKLKVD
jgi:hypothetical protein